jgi:hypothetical protein
MNSQQHPSFFNATMTGLFVGIIDTLICLSYNIGYRNFTGYMPSAIINVSSLIFAVNLILFVLILGVSAACVPFLYRSKKFLEHVI